MSFVKTGRLVLTRIYNKRPPCKSINRALSLTEILNTKHLFLTLFRITQGLFYIFTKTVDGRSFSRKCEQD